MPDLEPDPPINKPADNKVKDLEPDPPINTPADNQVKDDEFEGVNTLKTWREERPAHYRLKIESFSSLLKFLDEAELDNYESNEFEASGYKWKLLLYPDGDKERNGRNHISLYLQFINPWRKIKALLNFFVYSQEKKQYLSIQDLGVRRFDGPRKESRGRSRLVYLDCFRNDPNRFLDNDSCEFGVEVYVLEAEGEGKRECFRTLREQSDKVYVWHLKMPSDLQKTNHFSEHFAVVGDFKGKLHLYHKGKYLSIYLWLESHPKATSKEEVPAPWKVHVEFKLSVNDQVHENKSEKIAKRGDAWFSNSSNAWGFPKVIDLAESGKLKSLIVGNEMQIELQIISMSMTMPMSK